MRPDGILETSAGRFAYLSRGKPGGPPVLLLHGFPDHPPSWLPLMDRLAAVGFHAVAPWMRGYAPSVLDGPYDADRLAGDAVAMAEAIAPGRRVALVGHDWGAVATYAALAAAGGRFSCGVAMAIPHPISFLRNLPRRPGQLRRSWYMMFFQLPVVPERAVAAGDFALIDRLWRTWSPGFTLDDGARAALHRCLAASMPAPLAYYRALTRPVGAALARSRRGDRIATPLIHLHGDRDGCVAASAGRGQEKLFSGPFASEIVAGAGHFLQLETPDRVAELVIPWLARWRSPPRSP